MSEPATVENKVRFNLKNVYYAKCTSETTPTYGTPVAIPGAVSLDISQEGSTEDFYADGIVYYTSSANNGYTGTLEIAKVPEAFLTDILGETKDTNNVFVENATVNTSVFALGFQIDGDQNNNLFWMYRCKVERPNIASKTNENGAKTPNTVTLSFQARPLPSGKVKAMTGKDVASATTSAWFSSVYAGV